jgi:5'-methylthioadenosine phosphorylase
MGRLALVGGRTLAEGELAADAERREVSTPDGRVALLEGEGWVLLQRHGLDSYRAPHGIDHRANLRALAEAGCDRVLAIGSVGGLRRELAVGTFLAPDDFIALHLGLSYSEGHEGHRVPFFDIEWRARVLDAWRGGAEPAPLDGGVYWQAIGPRLETPAEIRMIAAHADVIGMTLASECVLSAELGLAYAAVCVVDNLANGVGARPLTLAEYEAGAAANRSRLSAALRTVLPKLTEEGK